MSDFHCLDIEFPSVDFSKYYRKGERHLPKVYHGHLVCGEDIELKIFCEADNYFDYRFALWTDTIDDGKFGSFIKVELSSSHTNEDILKIDFSEAKICGLSNGYDETNNKHYIAVKIDTVKFYYKPDGGEVYSGEFYLDNRGFRVVEPFYGIFQPQSFFKNDGKFEINRLQDLDEYYQFEKSTFRPEFNFYSKSNRKDRVATIIKEPKIQFKYKGDITEHDAIFYGDIVLMLASFYYHVKVGYTTRIIRLPEHTIRIINTEEKKGIDKTGGLRSFGINWTFDKFLRSSWQESTLKNFKLLSKVINLFNQSLIVDGASSFLIRYGIVEACGKVDSQDVLWSFTMNNEEVDVFFDDIKESIANKIQIDEREFFNNKWDSIQKIIKSKSLKKQLVDTLTKNNIDSTTLPIKTGRLVRLRNNITHGSIEGVKDDELRRVNILLYRICGIFILNLMGIKDWKLITDIR